MNREEVNLYNLYHKIIFRDKDSYKYKNKENKEKKCLFINVP